MVTKGYGLTVDDIDWSCPSDLEPYTKAYGLERKMRDADMWTMGMYNLSAFGTAIEHNFAGQKAKSSYIEKPFLQDKALSENKELTEEERKEMENYKLAMSLKIMKVNWDLNESRKKKLKGDSVS